VIRKQLRISLTLVIGLLALIGTLALLRLLGSRPSVVHAQGPDGISTYYVAPGGDCGTGITPCYDNIQAAVDAADAPDDVVKVAAGTYNDINVRPRDDVTTTGFVTQMVYITKTITIQGGYTTANWDTPYPITQPTVLDVEGQGRVLYITGDISTTIEGLHITGGDAAGLYGGANGEHAGGGVYVLSATTTIRDNWIFENTAPGLGGGLFLKKSTSTLSGNIITANTAISGGGGILLVQKASTLGENLFADNSALFGGGALLQNNTSTLNDNIFTSNSASASGGGLFLEISRATLNRNIITLNDANGSGGGLHLTKSNADLNGNIVISNTSGTGGGLLIHECDPTLSNNVVADNHALIGGSGLYIEGSSPRLLHTTIAHNRNGDGSGVYVTSFTDTVEEETYFSTVALTNTILVGHVVGISVTTGNTATLEATLWGSDTWANGTDWGGTGVIFTGTVNIWGTPAFVNPDDGDYHISLASAAVDQGVGAGVDDDMDGNPRPLGLDYDIGADELFAALEVSKQAAGVPLQAGATLTYTIRVTNTGSVTLTAIITDFLPNHVTPTGPLTWTTVITEAGDVWIQSVVVTLDADYTGPLTNVVQVTTEEGASGAYTHRLAPDLEVLKQASSNLVRARGRLTYTICVTNTGDFILHAIVTDALPAHVTPTGTIIWTPVITGPGSAWTQTVVVTAEMGYAGPLTNVVQVATAEGPTGAYTSTQILIHAPGVLMGPHYRTTANPGVITYTHTITNTGNAPDTFLLSHRSSRGWLVKYTPLVSLGYNETATVIISVTVPLGAGGLTDTTVITATSLADADIQSTVANTTTVNIAPVADAGPDQYVTPGSIVTLDGSGSSDPDNHTPLSYRWKRTGGPPVPFNGANTAQATLQAPFSDSVLTFTLTVFDALNLISTPDTVVVYVGLNHRLYVPVVVRTG